MSLLALSSMISIFFALAKTPLMLALLIVAQTAIVALSIYILLPTSWLSFILFMILVSAMMVIFAYVSSLASNDFMFMSFSIFISAWSLAPLLLLTACLTTTGTPPLDKSNLCMSDTDLATASLYKLYTSQTCLLTLFLILYLLIALIVAAKISLSSKGALRSMNR